MLRLQPSPRRGTYAAAEIDHPAAWLVYKDNPRSLQMSVRVAVRVRPRLPRDAPPRGSADLAPTAEQLAGARLSLPPER
jgi:hypothetical protein